MPWPVRASARGVLLMAAASVVIFLCTAALPGDAADVLGGGRAAPGSWPGCGRSRGWTGPCTSATWTG
ncbi:hypothetical protein ACFQ0B_24300 [Nonomuraea thailandensis]